MLFCSALKIEFIVHCKQSDVHTMNGCTGWLRRVDTNVGRGVRLSPTGVELDEQVVHLSKNTVVRAAAGVRLPRQIPVEPDDEEVWGLQVHRLMLKTTW